MKGSREGYLGKARELNTGVQTTSPEVSLIVRKVKAVMRTAGAPQG